MNEPVIQARDLRKRYKKTEALQGVTFEVMPGRIVGLVGPNGSGKTTTINAIVGMTDFDGDLTVLGWNPRTQRDQLMQEVAYVSDVAILPTWLKVSQLIDFVEGVHPKFSRLKALHYLSRTKITSDMKVKNMSKGMVAQLHLAVIMAIEAKLLVLDEPTLGLDIIHRKQFYKQLIEDYADDSRTIFLSTHQIDEVENVVTDLLFLNDGKVVFSETRDNVEQRFIEVTVSAEKVDEARQLTPIYERKLFGKTAFLFEGVDVTRLEKLGPVQMPSLSDLFLAKVEGGVR